MSLSRLPRCRRDVILSLFVGATIASSVLQLLLMGKAGGRGTTTIHKDHVHSMLSSFHHSQANASQPKRNSITSKKAEDYPGIGTGLNSFLELSKLEETNKTSSRLPDWLEVYLDWHAQQRSQLSPENWKNHRFLILRCLESDSPCGGVSDRLKPIPLLLLFAAASQRIFLIHWERPVHLQEFLLPSRLDWRLPSYVYSNDPKSSHLFVRLSSLMDVISAQDDRILLQTRVQDQHGGSPIYNAFETYRLNSQQKHLTLPLPNVTFQDAVADSQRHFRRWYRSIWSALFVPSPHLAEAIQLQHQHLGLAEHPGYVVAQVRTHYGNSPFLPDIYQSVADNGLRCASQLRQSRREALVFLSDSQGVLQAAAEYQRTHLKGRLPIKVAVSRKDPLHLDQSDSREAADYMSTFVDLYIMANAECISHGRGGFGRMGVLLSRNSSCFFRDFVAGKRVSCPYWKAGFGKV